MSQSTNLSTESRSPRLRLESVVILAAGAVLTATTLSAVPLASSNDRSRWCTVWSLVERQTYIIDAAVADPDWDTIDKVRHDGHFYSTKPALLPTLTAGVYWGLKKVTGWTLDNELQAVTQTILLLINVVPFLIALILLGRIAQHELPSIFARAFVMVAAGLGTLVTPFLTTFNNHTVAATGLMVTLYAAWLILSKSSVSRLTWLTAGFFAAWTCTNELPAAAFGVAIFLLLWRESPRKTWTLFVPAALVPLAGFFLTTWLSTGSWKPFYMYYGTEKYEYFFQGIPSYWMNPKQLDVSAEPTWLYLVHCTIGHHGLFSLSPILLLSLSGGIAAWCSWSTATHNHSQRAIRVLVRLGAFLSVLVLSFYLTRTSNYNYGGNSSALRWMLWLTPFWLISLIPVLNKLDRSTSGRSLALLLLAPSIFSATWVADTPWSKSWLYAWMEQHEWIDYSTPPDAFDPARTSVFGTIPDSFEQASWAEFASTDLEGRPIRLRITRPENSPADEDGYVPILLTFSGNQDQQSREVQVAVHRDRLVRGRPTREYLRLPDGLSEPLLSEVETLFQGVPSRPRKPIIYQRYLTRYVFNDLRAEAFECQRTGTEWTAEADSAQPSRSYRCDVWFCPDVPFGTIRFDRTVRDAAGDILRRESWSLIDASRIQPWTAPTEN